MSLLPLCSAQGKFGKTNFPFNLEADWYPRTSEDVRSFVYTGVGLRLRALIACFGLSMLLYTSVAERSLTYSY